MDSGYTPPKFSYKSIFKSFDVKMFNLSTILNTDKPLCILYFVDILTFVMFSRPPLFNIIIFVFFQAFAQC